MLILGTSHVGKSSTASCLSRMLGFSSVSTDRLARHPGRPWTEVPEPVIEFYLGLPADAHHWFLRVHHENMRPIVASRIASLRVSGGFVLEGAALRPEYLAGWDVETAQAFCLYADANVLRDRMLGSSRYGKLPERLRRATDAFIERSLRENDALVGEALRLGVPLIDTSRMSPEDIAKEICERFQEGRRP